jgi:SET domain-containing protein
MNESDREFLDKTLLHDYIFEWGEDKKKCCMALGNIPIYNHSYTSNCEYFMDFEEEQIFVKTVRDVQPGEELTINYNGDWNNAEKVWFEVTE